MRVADGLTDKGRNNEKLSDAARAIAPRGMMLVQWDADPGRSEQAMQVWYVLHPSKWQGKHTERERRIPTACGASIQLSWRSALSSRPREARSDCFRVLYAG